MSSPDQDPKGHDMTVINDAELEAKVKSMYRHVAEQPHGDYHFEMGRSLADRLGYPSEVLDRIPVEAIESFAGVGYFFDLAGLGDGERVIDLGSGSGMDPFFAAAMVGSSGQVVGVDFTTEQLAKARRLAAGSAHLQFREGRIENLPAADASFDCVISNGVINLAADKQRVFDEAARVLRPGGRLAIADIVTERQLTEAIVGNVDLWASCIGGAAHEDTYRQAIEAAGLRIEDIRRNDYRFLSAQARDASVTYGVKSTSVLAVKPSR
jgi:ubiquinone/menaquinone biosynthesis C-methylase UbiE